MFQVECQLQSQSALTHQHICKKALTYGKHNEIIIIRGGNIFIKRNGDTVEHFKCTEKTGEILDVDQCYEHISIKGG